MSNNLIKIKIFNMHLHRSDNPMDKISQEEDIGRMEGFNYYFIPERNYIYKNLQMVSGEDYDYAVCLDQVYYKNLFDPKKTILIRLEPECLRNRFRPYLENINPNDFLKVYDIYTLWCIPLPVLEANKFNKTKMFSAIISSNYDTDMHKKRIEFAKVLDKNFSYYEHFGRDSSGVLSREIKNYKGSIVNRIDGLQNYKYHFSSENSREPSGFSEKIEDALLCECLTFYDGASDLEKYINPNAFIRINLDDPEKSLHIIKTSIENGEWEKRIDIIREAKWDMFHTLNPLELIYKGINGIKNHWE